MDWKKFFKKDKQSVPPSNPDDPQGIDGTGAYIHPEAPTGTRFNRKLIMVLAILAGTVVMFTFVSALQPKKKPTPHEEANKPKTETPVNNVVLPESISSTPDTYSGLRKYEEEKKMREVSRKQINTGGQGISPDEHQYTVGDVKNTSQETINKYNPQAPGTGHGTGLLSDKDKEILDARKSPIRFANMGNMNTQPAPPQQNASAPQAPPAIQLPTMPWQQPQDDQNMQLEKREFRDGQKKNEREFYVKGGLMPALSKYEVKAGSIIPGVMITGINSDLPGRIVGQVRENVFDTVSGRYLLIPQGTKVVGVYDSKVAFAQDRALIIWTRLIFPNGDSIDLEGMDGVDLSGYAGLKDKVNNHYGKLITGVVLSSILSATAKVAAGNYDSGTATFGQHAASGAAEQVNSVGSKITDRFLNIQPTIEIRPGMKFNVFVNKDLILKSYKNS